MEFEIPSTITAGKEKEKADNNEKILEDIAITSSPVSDADRDKLRNKYRR